MALPQVSFEAINSRAHDAEIIPERLCIPHQGVSWRIAESALPLPVRNARSAYETVGNMCRKYHDTICQIYAENALFASVIDTYRDSCFLENVRLSASVPTMQLFYRPDLIVAQNGTFKIAEIDALPGEIGINCFLRDAYGDSHTPLVEAIHDALVAERGIHQIDFVIDAISSEDEYRAEYGYLATCLSRVGIMLSIYGIREYTGPKEQKTLVYRFFDMVHNDADVIESILMRVAETQSVLYPPLHHYTEEKLSMSTIHDTSYESFFLRQFEPQELALFRSLVPRVHWLDKESHAITPSIEIDGRIIRTFGDLANLAPDIPFILKTSGFSDGQSNSKGARSLAGCSREEVYSLLEEHIVRFDEHFILQKQVFPARLITHILTPDGSASALRGYGRLTPFCFPVGDEFRVVSAHMVIRDAIDVHFAQDASVIPIL